ncbi:hypothetical protein N7466_000283 [Penicillium verhagenii]|uniref:uncharacterized protein n=1 Tax=Penicillium verhagenii TaxID=1562060 RepID=UPI0025455D7E|nr:uncharacterized protein N7466_000283 [Penicillium verhagenii]KAJ5947268.1 hypothetical protein N7466_000283 [Penicillium verhagenii]
MQLPSEETSREECASNPDESIANPNTTLWQAFRISWKVVGACGLLTSAILLYGYDNVIVGTVTSIPAFQEHYGTLDDDSYILPALWLGIWNASGSIGTMIGAIMGGFIQDQYGRRLSLALGSALSAIAVAICYVSDLPAGMDSRRGVFLACKLLQGIAIGGVMSTTQTYMSEVLPPRLRGPVLAFFPIFTLFGQLVGAVVVYVSLDKPGSMSYRICFASQWVFSALPLILATFLPESPSWLTRQSQQEKAFKAQRRLEDSDAAASAFRLLLLKERQLGTSSYLDCFKQTNLRRTWIVAFANILPQLWGLTLLANASYFLQVIGMKSGISIIFLIVGIALGLVSNVISMKALDLFGRRYLSLMGMGISTVLWLAMGIAGCFHNTEVIMW